MQEKRGKGVKKLAPFARIWRMYPREEHPEFVNFYLPFNGKLDRDNRWVRLAGQMPWEKVQEAYRQGLAGSQMGAPAKSGRIAFGALIIKERLGISDQETVEQIAENPYLQYFLGLSEYRAEPLFDPSMMVHFRKRFGQEQLDRINEEIVKRSLEQAEEQDHDGSNEQGGGSSVEAKIKQTESKPQQQLAPNQGKLVIDATCGPADMSYPTDLKLLGDAREKSEEIIDVLYEELRGECKKKPRTYRQRARKEFLAAAKAKKLPRKQMRKAVGKQICYVRRNLKHIDKLLEMGARLGALSKYQLKCLWVIRVVLDQQRYMYKNRVNRVDHRIVSISQPHVRPIVRGKAGSAVEFGAKISVSLCKGYVSMDHLSWENFNEGLDLQAQVEAFVKRFGCYPKSVHADKIYRTQANRKFCKEHHIQLSGAPLGRPPKLSEEQKALMQKESNQAERQRILIEGKFGNAKGKGTLARVMAKLADTSRTVINISLIVLNLDTWLRIWSCFMAALHLSIHSIASTRSQVG